MQTLGVSRLLPSLWEAGSQDLGWRQKGGAEAQETGPKGPQPQEETMGSWHLPVPPEAPGQEGPRQKNRWVGAASLLPPTGGNGSSWWVRGRGVEAVGRRCWVSLQQKQPAGHQRCLPNTPAFPLSAEAWCWDLGAEPGQCPSGQVLGHTVVRCPRGPPAPALARSGWQALGQQ